VGQIVNAQTVFTLLVLMVTSFHCSMVACEKGSLFRNVLVSKIPVKSMLNTYWTVDCQCLCAEQTSSLAGGSRVFT
jgi:hypothetical protein